MEKSVVERIAFRWGELSLAAKLLTGIVAALVLWVLWGLLIIRIVGKYWMGTWSPDGQQLGQIGDLFGGVNALFAAFAFVGVAIAAFYQHKTFKLQADQNVRQAFEPLFFMLLDRHSPPSALVAKFDSIPRATQEQPLEQCMATMRLKIFENDGSQGMKAAPLSGVKEIYGQLYWANDGVLAPYFRKLYHLFKFIALSDLPVHMKVQYANIARAGLNKDELLLLAVNCVAPQGVEFKPIIEGLGLLKHLWGADGVNTPDTVFAKAYIGHTATMSHACRVKYWARNPTEQPVWMMAVGDTDGALRP